MRQIPNAATVTADFAEKARNKRREDLYDTEYWVAVCFSSREQVQEFLRKLEFDDDAKYISGPELVEAIGEKLEASGVQWPTRRSRTVTDAVTDELADPLPSASGS